MEICTDAIIRKVINEHIADENFSIELLSKESAMSKEQIYKKLKALTHGAEDLQDTHHEETEGFELADKE